MVTQSSVASQIGRVVGDRYRLEASLGAGASARVFLAADTRLSRQVAVKMLEPALATDAQFLERFRAEARIVGGINHPNVVVVHDWGEEDDTAYLVTEYLAGGSLRAMLKAGSTLAPSQALVIGLDVCRGLAHAHGQGLVHRDLKPANLLFDPEGRLRIADFGLARAIAEAAVTEQDGSFMGSARYAAPEQARGQRLDGKADVYALAVCLVEAVTGEVPFASDTALGTLMARTETDLIVPDALGPLRGAVQAAGRLDPDERPDAEEFGIALLAASERLSAPAPLPLVGALAEAEQAVDDDVDERTRTLAVPVIAGTGDVDSATPEPPTDEPATTGDRKRRRWPLALLAVLLVAIGAGGYFAFNALRTPTHEVPDVIGEDIAQLELVAAQNDWVLEESKTRRNGTEPGEILSTDPAPGESLAEGGTLTVLVSLGNEMTETPQGIENKPLAEVEAAFDDAGLVLVPAETHHEEIAAGNVIGYETEPDGQVPQETELTVLVSLGPAPRTVPSLGNNTDYGAYAAALEEVQLVPKRSDEFSETVPEGVVIRISHDPGAEVPRDTEITVVVSKGPDVVEVPDLIGKRFKEAEEELESLGLEVGTTNRNNGTVIFTDPSAGTELKRGSAVDIFLRRGGGNDD